MSTKTSSYLAFIVGTKNEHLVVNYISEHYDDLSLFTILFTDTDTKGLEKFTNTDLNIIPASSLDKRGDTEIATLAAKNKICAIVIMNYSSISNQFPPDRLAQLLEKTWGSDIPICMNTANIDLVISNLVSLRGLEGISRKKRTGGINKAMQTVLLTRFPSFDLELTDKDRARRERPGKWTEQQWCGVLEARKLEYLKPLLNMEKTYPDCVTEETKYFTRDEDIPGFFKLKSAPLEKSLEYLTVGPQASIREIWDYTRYERDFLISHHMFTTSLELLKRLRKRYQMPAPPPASEAEAEEDHKPASAIIVVLRDWILMEYGSDFSVNVVLCQEFEDMMKNDISKDDPESAKELTEMFNTALALETPYYVDLSKAPVSNVPKKNKAGKFDFATSFAPQEVGRQMSLMDEQLFHKVRAKEFLGGAWTKKDANVRAPNLTKFINHTNRTAGWVVTEILKEKNIQSTSELIAKFIHIGKELLELRNYNGVMCILTALHSATIGRLKSAWAGVPNREKKDFEDLTEALSLLGHYKNYRETLKTLPPSTPCIPLIPVTCSDLNGLGEVLENMTEEGWINWDKHSKVANHIWSVKRFMRARYIFKPVEAIRTYIEKAEVWEGEKTLAAIAKLRDNLGNTSQRQSGDMRHSDPNVKKEKKQKEKSEKNKKSNKDIKMSERDWAVLEPGSESKRYSAGDVVLGLGVVNRHLFRVKKGVVRVEKIIGGQPVTIDKMKEKSMFGEISMLLRAEQGTTTAAIVADENGTDVIKYKIEFVMDMCRVEPEISEKLHKIITLKLSERLRNFGGKKNEPTKEKEKKEKKEKHQENEEKLEKKELSEENLPAMTNRRDTRSSTRLLGDLSSSGQTMTGSPMEERVDRKIAKLEKKASVRMNPQKKEKTKKERTQEDDFKKWFQLDDSEIAVRMFSCAMKSTISTQGTLYVSQSYLCFSAYVFGRRTKEKLPFLNVQDLRLTEKRIELTANGKSVYFKDFDNKTISLEDAFTYIKNFYDQMLLKNTAGSTPNIAVDEDAEEEDNGMLPNNQDWVHILEGTRSIHYQEGEYVITEGQASKQRLYQISKGSCRIEKKIEDGTILRIGVITTNDSIFGEISFLEGTSATASVVANEVDTVVHVIEGYYLDVLFDYYPGLSGRFYHYLATVLSTRLKLRENSAQKTGGKVANKDEDESEMEEEEKPSKNLVSRTQNFDAKKKKKRKSSKRMMSPEDEWVDGNRRSKEGKMEKTEEEEINEEEKKD